VRCIGADLTEVPLEEATVVSVYRLLDTASISTGGPSAPTWLRIPYAVDISAVGTIQYLGTWNMARSRYLLPEAVAQIRPKLLECLQRGARVVCNTWGIVGMTPAATATVQDPGRTMLSLYTQDSLPDKDDERAVPGKEVDGGDGDGVQ
jgi:hypothetical protein